MNNIGTKEIILASPRGFCAGVQRAIDIVEKALVKYGAPIYVKHQIVHNEFVVNNLIKKGAIFVDNIEEIPNGAITIFSAHGVTRKTEDDASQQNLQVFDATCPLVKKVHFQAIRDNKQGKEIILIGHKTHPEVIGTSGRINANMQIISCIKDIDHLQISDPNNLSYITQTTLSVDDTKTIIEALKEKYPTITGPDTNDICYATQNRQTAVKQLSTRCDLILVIGSRNSSNSNRLRDIANELGTDSYLINNSNDIKLEWFSNKHKIGVTAGASAPEELVNEVIKFLSQNFNTIISELTTTQENINFKLPKELL